MTLVKKIKKDKLITEVYETRRDMGIAAAKTAAEIINEVLEKKEFANVIFAAAPSQNELLEALSKADVDWKRVNAFHMDEYVGFNKTVPQSFGSFLNEHIFSKVPFNTVYYIADCKDIYADLIKENPIDLVCMGIGENGHIAFNDPGVADFNDSEVIKVVDLDPICRQQQVNDGCFPTLADVPTQAYTLTIPTLCSAANLVCVVPGPTKRDAVRRTINDSIDENCPATIMRHHNSAVMYCDTESGADLL